MKPRVINVFSLGIKNNFYSIFRNLHKKLVIWFNCTKKMDSCWTLTFEKVKRLG